MAWIEETAASAQERMATDYRDFVVKMTAAMTGRAVSSEVISAGGTGYAVDDELLLPNGTLPPARWVVTTIGGGGAVTGLRRTSSGCYGLRVTAIAVTAGQGGTGYAVGDVFEIQGGTSREKGKGRVLTETAGVVDTIEVFETGGAYSVAPPAGSATDSTIGEGTGTGLQVDVTTADAALQTATQTSGAGTGCTVTVTTIDGEWTVERSLNNIAINGLTDEKEVVYRGDAGGNAKAPRFAIGTGTTTNGLNTRYWCAVLGLLNFNPSLPMTGQAGRSPGSLTVPPINHPYLLFSENQALTMPMRISITDTRVTGFYNVNRSAGTSTDLNRDMQFYFGFLDRASTQNEDPYPMFIAGNASQVDLDPLAESVFITGLGEARKPDSSGGSSCGFYFYRAETQTWIEVNNPLTDSSIEDHVILPIGRNRDLTEAPQNYGSGGSGTVPLPLIPGSVSKANRDPSSTAIVSTPGSVRRFPKIPLTLVSRPGGINNAANDTVRGRLAGVLWRYNSDLTGGAAINHSEDILVDPAPASTRYTVAQTHALNERYHYVAFENTL